MLLVCVLITVRKHTVGFEKKSSLFIGILGPNRVQVIGCERKLHNVYFLQGINDMTGLRKVRWEGYMTGMERIKPLHETCETKCM